MCHCAKQSSPFLLADPPLVATPSNFAPLAQSAVLFQWERPGSMQIRCKYWGMLVLKTTLFICNANCWMQVIRPMALAFQQPIGFGRSLSWEGCPQVDQQGLAPLHGAEPDWGFRYGSCFSLPQSSRK